MPQLSVASCADALIKWWWALSACTLFVCYWKGGGRKCTTVLSAKTSTLEQGNKVTSGNSLGFFFTPFSPLFINFVIFLKSSKHQINIPSFYIYTRWVQGDVWVFSTFFSSFVLLLPTCHAPVSFSDFIALRLMRRVKKKFHSLQCLETFLFIPATLKGIHKELIAQTNPRKVTLLWAITQQPQQQQQ